MLALLRPRLRIAGAGSFLTRTVAGRDFIFSRDSAGQVHVLYNLCTHRGGRVCREKSGKASVFQCFYHGWVFGTDGGLRLIPQEGAYPDGYKNDRDRGLVPVPRLEKYRGFWFINLDANAMSLFDYLAGAKEYLDNIVDQSEIGMAIVPGGQNFQVDANWKLWHENGMDPFHVHTVHATYFEYSADVLKVGKENAQASGVSTEAFDTKASAEVMMKGRYAALMQTKTKLSFDLGNGHMAYNYPSTHGRPFAQWHPSWDPKYKPELDQLYDKLVARVGPERARTHRAFRPSHPDLSEPRDRGQPRHHDPHLLLEKARGNAGAELDHCAEGGVRRDPQAAALQLHGFSGTGRVRNAG